MAQPIPFKFGSLRLEYLLALAATLLLLPAWIGPLVVSYPYQAWCAQIAGCQRLMPVNRIEPVDGGTHFRQHLQMKADLRTLVRAYGTKDHATEALRELADRQYPAWQQAWLRLAPPVVQIEPARKGEIQP